MKTPKIIVTHLTDVNTYYFELPCGTWVINGKEYTNQKYTSEKITTLEQPVIFKVEPKTEIVRYKNIDEGEINYTVGEYQDALERLKSKGTWCDLDEVYTFDSLEDEFAYKKFKRDWQAVTEVQLLKYAVEIEIRHAMINTGSPFITPLFCVDQSKPELVEVKFVAYQKHVVTEWLKVNNVTDYDFPTHSHLEYFKMQGKYVFTSGSVRNEYNGNNPVRVVAFEAAQRILDEEKKKIEGALYSVLCSLRAIPDVSVRELITEIQSVSSYMRDTKKSKTDMIWHCRAELQKIVTRLQNLSTELVSKV